MNLNQLSETSPTSEPLQEVSEIGHGLSAVVYIVGAGPGDPELLTVKAQKLIQRADVLVYANSLVPPQIFSTMRPDTEKIATANMTLEEIVPLMVERVRAGKSVVRLHSGDPSLYSAIHEQMLRLREAEVLVEVVPGISAFQAAAAKLQVELTIPAVVQSIILTRISGRTQVPVAEELASLAAHQASLCLYLSARHVNEAQAQLLQHYPPQTPVAICFRVGWPDEQIKVVTLEKMAQVSEAEALVRTTLYIVSPALANVPLNDGKAVRSRLYNPTHDHLFRPHATPQLADHKQIAEPQIAKPQTVEPQTAEPQTATADKATSINSPNINSLNKEQEHARK